MKKLSKAGITLLLVISFILPSAVYIPHVLAQNDNVSIGISPTTFPDLVADPGQTISKVLTIYNTGDKPVECQIEIKDYKPVGENGAIMLQDAGTEQNSLANWITLSQTDALVQAHSHGHITFSISIPFNAEPGGRYASIVVATKNNVANDQSGVDTDIGSLIFLTVSGNITLAGNLQSFSATDVFDQSSIQFAEKIVNTGDVHFHYSGNILVKNIFGIQVSKVQIADMTVLPQATRISTQSLNAQNFWGPYSASITLSYTAGQKSMIQKRTVYFWALPIIPLTISILILTLIILFRQTIKQFFHAFMQALKSTRNRST